MSDPDSDARGLDNGVERVVRVDDTMRRPAGPWTPSVHALLAHLRSVGFEYAPEPLGVDDEGRDVVSYIEGDHGVACWDRINTDAGLRRFGRLLREYHDAVASYRPLGDARWKLPALVGRADPSTDDVIVCHGDFAPWNIVWHADQPVGVIDWELARPRPRLDDVAWAAIWSVPLRSDEEAVTGWDCWTTPPDRRHRLRVFLDGYARPPGDVQPGRVDPDTPSAMVDRAIVVLCQTYEDVLRLAEQGHEPQRTWLLDGSAESDLRRADWIDVNRDSLL